MTAEDDRQARLAAALRANLKRRKTAARPGSPGPPAPGEIAEPAPRSGEDRKPQ